ncbi:MAG TPA: aspartate aminotransferase family protein [Methylomirabilota bacterium]|nr:aspartate aminotransferase family protein [Methylomirabilota bacterium]
MRTLDRSRALLERARRSLAGGVSSPVRARAPVPLYFQQGRGARLQDVDGNWYIDYALAWGPIMLGYDHPALIEAARRAAERPFTYGAQHELEIEVAEKIQRVVSCAERVTFSSSGSEAVQLAHRLARAFTGRNLILKFEGHYHGWIDGALVSYHPGPEGLGPRETPRPILGSLGQVPNVVDNVLVAPWNRLDVLERLFAERPGQIAAVMMEPVLCNSGCLMPTDGYLAGVQALCRRHGALLILDEVITGFRIALGGAQAHFGVTPDLATFGKAVAGGAPLSVVAGRRAIMEQLFGAGVAFGGTFNGNPLSLAIADATLTELVRDGGAAIVRANEAGRTLRTGIERLAARHGVPLTVTGFGAAFALHFTTRTELRDYRDTLDDDADRLTAVLARGLEEGLHLLPDGRLYLSAAHGPSEVAETLAAFDRILAEQRAPVPASRS